MDESRAAFARVPGQTDPRTPQTASFGPSAAVMTAAHTSASRTFEGEDPVIGHELRSTVVLVLRAFLRTRRAHTLRRCDTAHNLRTLCSHTVYQH